MKNFFLLFIFILTFTSCASRHSRMDQTVTLKVDDKKGVACIKTDSLQVGGRLQLMDHHCEENELMSDAMTSCSVKKYGEVVITKIINDHYVEFETDKQVVFEEGTIIKFLP